MPILHISITDQNQQIILDTDINAQMLTLKKCCITTNSANSSRLLKGGIGLEFPFLTGAETLSNVFHNAIVVPFDELNAEKYTEIRFDSDLQAEHIPRSFLIQTRNFENKKVKFQGKTLGEVVSKIEQIDLFFEYKTSHKFF